jgi:hypothetical protein
MGACADGATRTASSSDRFKRGRMGVEPPNDVARGLRRGAAAVAIGVVAAALSACVASGSTRRASTPQDSMKVAQPERNTTTMWGYDPAIDATWEVGQTFIVPRNGLAIEALTVWVEAAYGDGLSVEIHETASEQSPEGTLLRSIEIDPRKVQAYRDLRIDIEPALPTKADAVYGFVFVPRGRSTIQLGLHNRNPYVGGSGYSFDPQPGHGWRAEVFDLSFTIDLTDET